MSNEVRIPDIEIIVGAAGDDVAIFAFYRRDDIHQGYDILCGVEHESARPVIRQVLQDAIQALVTADWHSVDELHLDALQKEDTPPF